MRPWWNGSSRRDLAGMKPGNAGGRNVEGWLLPVIALLALIGFGTTIIWVRGTKTLNSDVRATLAVQSLRDPLLYRLMTLVSSLGYVPAIHLILFGTAGLLWLAKKRLESVFALASAGGAAMVVMVKRLIGRPRPTGGRIRVAVRLPDSGFPSGHTVHYVSFYGFLAYLTNKFLEPDGPRRVLITLFALLIALVGPSRIYLGQHWLSDVIAAYLFGLSYLIGLTQAYERIKAMRSR